MAKRSVMLECTVGGASKWYKMEQDKSGGRITATWGSIGGPSKGSALYNDYEWDKKYNEKIRKGYVIATKAAKNSAVGYTWVDGLDEVKEEVKKVKIVGTGSVCGMGYSVNHFHKIGDEGLMSEVDKKGNTCLVTVNGLSQEVCLKDVEVINK